MVRILTINEQINEIGLDKNNGRLSTKKNIDPCKEFKSNLIKEIVKKTLIELAVALAFTAAACFFVATPIGMATLLLCSIAAIAINIILRSVNAYCINRLYLLKYDNSPAALEKKARFQMISNFLQYLVPTSFSTLVDANTRELIVHEGGHALAAQILVKNPNPRITINPLQGGQTTYRIGALSKVGEFFGRENSKLLIAAGGPALAVGAATVAFGTSYALRKSNPELSRYLRVIAIDSIVQHAFYAVSALWTSAARTSHDFVRLMAGGIHPIAAAVSIIALPLIVRIGFFIYDKVKEKAAAKAAQRNIVHFNKDYMIKLPSDIKAYKKELIAPAA